MYDVLVVDDEPVARQSLRYLIDWEEIGFSVRAEAEDGRQALAMMKEKPFALVLTDIRMPTMNGLELIAGLREFCETPVVIMSGYDDFEYAREGIKLGVKDYLLKPVDEAELVSLLRKLAAELRERQLLERRRRLGLSAGRDQFLRRLAHGQVRAGELEEQLQLLALGPADERHACMLVELDGIMAGDLTEREAELKRFAVRNIAEEWCAGKGYVFEESDDRLGILLAGGGGDLSAESLRNLAEQLVRSASRFAKETVSVGIGCSVDSAADIRRSWREAEDALDGKFLSGSGSVLEARQASGEGDREDLRAMVGEVLDAVRNHRRGDALRALARLWDSFRTEQVPANRAKLTVLELLIQLFRLLREQGASHDRVFDPSPGDYERVMRSRTMDELLTFAERKIADVTDALDRMKELRPNKIVGEVKRIVQEQYADNVSLRSVAKVIYMNPNYIGKLFKAHTDLSFNDYVLQVRMEKAKELLLRTDKKVYEIAQEVGFAELDWFYKRFKAYTGISASEFRNAR